MIWILAFTMSITVMTSLMFNIVLPEIRADYDLSFAQASWVSTAYLLVFAIGTVFYGKLADVYRLKNLLTFGIIFFALGSMIGLSAQNYGMVIVGRILQAAGAAVIPASSGILPVRYFAAEQRGRAFGITAVGGAIGIATAPVVAALVVSTVHWRFLFCVPLLALITLPYYRKYLNDESGHKRTVDWAGGAFLAATIALLLLTITNPSWLTATACLILFVLFLIRIRSAKEPFVRPELFASKGYSIGLMIAFIMTGISYSTPFLTPQMLTQVNHLEPGLVGFSMVPAAIATAFLGRTGGRIADAKGNSPLFYMASALLLTCFGLLSTFTGTYPAVISLFLIFGTVGQSFLSISLSNSISQTLSKEQSGVGMGLLAMLNFIAGAIAASLYSLAVDHGANANWNPANGNPDAFVYSNIYFVLVLLLLAGLVFYYFMFGRSTAAANPSKTLN